MKRKSKVVEKPKRRRRKKPTENTLDGWAGIILKKKRKRVRKHKGEMVICCNNKCWYEGDCPHKKKHMHTEACENDFCSLMGIKTNCRKATEGDV